MSEVADGTTSTDLLAVGRRHLAVRDYSSASSTLAMACEQLAKEHGDLADQCAEAYLWYGKALLGLAREESGVLGDKIPDSGNEDDEDDEEDEGQEENGENMDEGTNEEKVKKPFFLHPQKKNDNEPEVTEKKEPETTKHQSVPSSTTEESGDQPGTSNGDAHDESIVNMDAEDDVDNLQLAWEMLDLSRSILERRGASSALLAEVHLALGEVALESETYDKAIVDMVHCLEIQKEIYKSDDRRIAETHYQIALANSLASNFEDAITHYKNSANILETRIKSLESSETNADKQTDSAKAEIKELKELLPEIQVKIQDMMDYKAETIKKVRDVLYPSNGAGPAVESNGAGASSSSATAGSEPAKDISHLIKRKRKPSDSEEPAPKRVNS